MNSNYQVLKAFSAEKLNAQVNDYVRSGFQVMGGVSTASVNVDAKGEISANGTPTLMFVQAVFRSEKSNGSLSQLMK